MNAVLEVVAWVLVAAGVLALVAGTLARYQARRVRRRIARGCTACRMARQVGRPSCDVHSHVRVIRP